MTISVLSVLHSDPGLSDLMLSSVKRYLPNSPVLLCDYGAHEYMADDQVSVIKAIAPAHSTGSYKHGAGLNRLWPMVRTPYVLILDSDCALLATPTLTRALTAAWKNGTQTGYHHMCCVGLRVAEFPGLDFLPEGTRDVGFRVQHSDLDVIAFTDTKTGRGLVFDSSYQCDELYLDGALLATHLGRGSNYGAKRQKTDRPLSEQINGWKQRVKELIK